MFQLVLFQSDILWPMCRVEQCKWGKSKFLGKASARNVPLIPRRVTDRSGCPHCPGARGDTGTCPGQSPCAHKCCSLLWGELQGLSSPLDRVDSSWAGVLRHWHPAVCETPWGVWDTSWCHFISKRCFLWSWQLEARQDAQGCSRWQ